MLSTLATTYDTTCPPILRLRGQNSPEPIRDGELAIRPVMTSDESSFGAEVFGVDWSRPVPEEIVNKVGGSSINIRNGSSDEGGMHSLSNSKINMAL